MIGALRRRATAAAAREKIIELMIPQVPEESAGSLRAQLQYYREFSAYQTQRLLTYLSGTRAERLRAAVRNYRQGLYQAHGRQGARDAIVDIIYEIAD